jgi:two-component system cell cycle sensor histidine kinase/response regulator CckA
LLISDVVMPKMNGIELAGHVKTERAEIRILFMSGYTDHAILQHGRLNPEQAFLQKPFTIHTLAARVRDAIDGLPEPALSAG